MNSDYQSLHEMLGQSQVRLASREVLVVVTARSRKEIGLGQTSVRLEGYARRYAQAKARKVCPRCGKASMGHHVYCTPCVEQNRKLDRDRRAKPVKAGYCYECHWRKSEPGAGEV